MLVNFYKLREKIEYLFQVNQEVNLKEKPVNSNLYALYNVLHLLLGHRHRQ